MNYRFFLSALLAILSLCPTGHAQTLPIRPTRTIAFATREGSYMNVDLSPDGKTLAFDLLGDLYTLPVAGGIALQRTHGIALHVRPVWSPDGSNIAFISDQAGSPNLTIMNLSGSRPTVLGHVQVTGETHQNRIYGQEPVWAADGRSITFGSQTYTLDGRELAAPSPFAQLLRCSGHFAFGLDSGRLCRYDTQAKTTTLLSLPLPRFQTAALSPDIHWWCYIADSGAKTALFARNLASGQARLLVPSLYLIDPNYKSGTPPPHFSFSPDSKTLFIGYGGHLHRIDLASGSDRLIPFLAHVKVDLGPRNYHTVHLTYDSLHVRYTRSASASPDGKHLVFSALDQLYIMDLPNGAPRLLAPQPFGQFQPAWSPDGQWIAYTSWADTIGGFLWKVPAIGGQPQQLTFVPGQYQCPAWSPDGSAIAVLRGEPIRTGDHDNPGLAHLELLALDRPPIQTLDDSLPLWNTLTFSPDGKNLLYTPKYSWQDDYQPQYIARDIHTGHVRPIALGSAQLTFYAQKALSPDHRYLVYSADEDLYLVPLTASGSAPDLSALDLLVLDNNRLSDSRLTGIRFAAGVDPYWENGGKTLAWSYANQFYRIDPDKILAAAKKISPAPCDTPQAPPVTVSLAPDQQVALHVTVPAAHAHGLLALRNVRLITMKGSQVIEHATLLLRNGRIAALGPMASTPIPPQATILDLPGTTVMPGLIDLHLHLRYVPSDIFPQQCWPFLASLAYGVTTARDPSLSFDSFGYAELLRSGRMIGPRLLTVGRPVRFNDGVLRFDSPRDAKAVVWKRATLGGSEIKQYSMPTRLKRQWLLLACEKARVNMTNEGSLNPLPQLAMLKDGTTGIEHNPSWGDAYNDILSLLARSRSYLTPTLQVAYNGHNAKPYLDYTYWRHPDAKWLRFVYAYNSSYPALVNAIHSGSEILLNAHPKDSLHPAFLAAANIDARIRRLGGTVVLGGHGDDQGIGSHNELWALQAGGLSSLQALQAATILGAQALGLQHDLGSLEPGKIADLLVLNANPLDNIHNSRSIRFVMKDGVLYDANTLDARWPAVQPCPDWLLHPAPAQP